jgi:hypothetical protein
MPRSMRAVQPYGADAAAARFDDEASQGEGQVLEEGIGRVGNHERLSRGESAAGRLRE